MLEYGPFGIAFLVDFPACLLDNYQTMPCSIHGVFFLVKDEIFTILDELFGKLPESQPFCFESGFDELSHGTCIQRTRTDSREMTWLTAWETRSFPEIHP